VGPVVIVIHPPALDHVFHLIDVQEQLAIEQFVTHATIEELGVALCPAVLTSF
jgi:hypothetical protein